MNSERIVSAAQTRRLGSVVAFVLAFALGSGWATSAIADESEHEALFDEVTNYLDVSERIVDLSSKPIVAIYFALEGINEIYDQQGNKAKAIPHLRRILDAYPENLSVRNIVLFKLRDVYKETGQLTKPWLSWIE